MKRKQLIGRVVPRNFHGYRSMVMALQTEHGVAIMLMIRLSRSKTSTKVAGIEKLYLKSQGRVQRKMALGVGPLE